MTNKEIILSLTTKDLGSENIISNLVLFRVPSDESNKGLGDPDKNGYLWGVAATTDGVKGSSTHWYNNGNRALVMFNAFAANFYNQIAISLSA